jgi:hypothetical protein
VIRIADLSVAAVVTRTRLGLGNLDIDDGAKFILGRAIRVGAVTWRREAVESPYVHGRIPVLEVMGAAESSIEVYALGSSHASLNSNLGELIAAFTKQYDYDLVLNVEGVTHQWRCERADYEVGFVTETLLARVVPVKLTFHRHPIPIQGVF